MNTRGQSSIELLIALGALITVLLVFSSMIMEQNHAITQIKAGKKVERIRKNVEESQLDCFSNREIDGKKKKSNPRWFR